MAETRTLKGLLRSPLVLAAQVAVTIGLLAWIAASIDAADVSAIRRIDLATLAAAIALFASAQIFGGLRLAVLVADTPVSWRQAMTATWMGYFFANFLPSTVGGDAARLYQLTRAGLGFVQAGGAIVLDRLCNLAILGIIVACAAGPLAWSLFGGADRNAVLVSATVACAGVLAIGVALLTNERVVALARQATIPFQTLLQHPLRLIVVAVLSILNLGVAILAQWLVARQLGMNISLLDMAGLIALVTLIILVPVSFNGLGLQEASFVALLARGGTSTDLAMSFALLSRLLIIGVSLLAGLVVLADRVQSRSPTSTNP